MPHTSHSWLNRFIFTPSLCFMQPQHAFNVVYSDWGPKCEIPSLWAAPTVVTSHVTQIKDMQSATGVFTPIVMLDEPGDFVSFWGAVGQQLNSSQFQGGTVYTCTAGDPGGPVFGACTCMQQNLGISHVQGDMNGWTVLTSSISSRSHYSYFLSPVGNMLSLLS